MPLVQLTVLTAIGSLVWNVALVGAGTIPGNRSEEVGDVVGILEWLFIVVVGLAGWFAWSRFLGPRLARAGDLAPPEQPFPGAGA